MRNLLHMKGERMIYLMRHGLDDERFIGGWSDIGLVEEGKIQVKRATKYLLTLPIENIISSDVKRAIQTADIVNEKLNLDVTYDSRLRELDKGLLTGLPVSKVKEIYPDYLNNTNIYIKYPKGSAMIDLYYQIKELICELKTLNNTLLITHRGVINMIYYILNEIELDMDKNKFNVTHASIHEVEFDKKLIRRIY